MPRCKICKERFTPRFTSLQRTCEKPSCIIEMSKIDKERKWAKEKKERKENLMTLQDYVKACQQVFNAFIRKRDTGKPCISCDRPLKGKYDAGHYYSVGAYPNLRFDEDNVFGQCTHCNMHKGGNISEYALRLPKRIGQEAFDALTERRMMPKNYSIPEIKEKIVYYKSLMKNTSE
jgi:hypothetical protein